MFYNADSGLYLTQFRAYDPVVGRWLSRDPVGETSDKASNLYIYVNNEPLSKRDITGLYTFQLGVSGGGTLLGVVVGQSGFGVAVDTNGVVGVYTYAGVGGGAGVEANLGASIQFSNAPTIYDLKGLFANASLHGGAGLGGSVDYFTGASDNVPIAGGGITFGASAGASGALIGTETEICGWYGCQGPIPIPSLPSMWNPPCR